MITSLLASRFLKPGLLILALLLIVSMVYSKGRAAGEAATTAIYEAKIAEAREEARLLADAYRIQEKANAQEMAVIDQQHQEALTNAQAEADRVLESVRAGTVRVRNKLTCPKASSGVSDVASTTSSGDAGEGSGLSQADAELVLRIAAEADQVVHQLKACQAIVRADRQL